MIIQCPLCPLCSAPPMTSLGSQAFCGNPGCTLVCWDRAHTLDENLLDAAVVHLTRDADGP